MEALNHMQALIPIWIIGAPVILAVFDYARTRQTASVAARQPYPSAPAVIR